MLVTGMLAAAAPARADITGFLGLAGGPSVRGARGLALGVGLIIVGVEFEYSEIVEDVESGAPRLRTGMVNGLVQTPIPIAGAQFYATAGGGVYTEELGSLSETHVGVNFGGGVKWKLVGPLRLRFDYRLIRLAGSPIAADVVHRFYVGANIKF
jgi:opacity protein-like surface antigen